MNLLDWLPADAQKPVLAHELTHALQDQQVGLEKWELAGAKDDAALPDQQEYFVEEAQSGAPVRHRRPGAGGAGSTTRWRR